MIAIQYVKKDEHKIGLQCAKLGRVYERRTMMIIQRKCYVDITSVGLAHARPITVNILHLGVYNLKIRV